MKAKREFKKRFVHEYKIKAKQEFKMWLGQLPLLTKGPFALMYGGQDIINQVILIIIVVVIIIIIIIRTINNQIEHVQLSSESPGRGVPSLILLSTIFQATIIDHHHDAKNFPNCHGHYISPGQPVHGEEGDFIEPAAELPRQPQRHSGGECLEHVII